MTAVVCQDECVRAVDRYSDGLLRDRLLYEVCQVAQVGETNEASVVKKCCGEGQVLSPDFSGCRNLSAGAGSPWPSRRGVQSRESLLPVHRGLYRVSASNFPPACDTGTLIAHPVLTVFHDGKVLVERGGLNKTTVMTDYECVDRANVTRTTGPGELYQGDPT